MSEVRYRDLAQGITCIDANYGGPDVACFYLLEHAGECAIIETGTSLSLDSLRQCMADKELGPGQVRYVIPTHVHLDHAGGAGAMMATFPEATLVVHPRGGGHLIDPRRLIESSIAVYGEQRFRALYGEIVAVEASRVVMARDGLLLTLGGRELLVRHTPGHADHHFCVWDKQSRGWFSGDMFGVSYPFMRFTGGDFVMVSTTPTQFRPEAFLESLQLLDSYGPARMFLTHYGELAYSPALAELLCRQVEAYRDIAPVYEDDPDALERPIEAFTLECMAPFAGPDEIEACRGKIAMDVRLNAQGLAIWQGRQKSRSVQG